MVLDPNNAIVFDGGPFSWRYWIWAFGYENTAAFASLALLLLFAPFCLTGDEPSKARKCGRYYACAHVQAMFFQLMLVVQGLVSEQGDLGELTESERVRIWWLCARSSAFFLALGAFILACLVGFVWRYSERAPRPTFFATMAPMAPCSCWLVIWVVGKCAMASGI